MRIDIRSRNVRIAAGAVGFALLVAWLVPPTTPRSLPSPLRAFAGVDSHRDDAARRPARTAAYSAEAWKRWHAGQSAMPAVAQPAFVPVPVAVPAPRATVPPPRRVERDDGWRRWEERDWEAREADRRRWIERNDREQWEEEQRWARQDALREPDRAERRERRRAAERRAARWPEDEPYYPEEEGGY